MAKYLDHDGLSYFWGKTKEYVDINTPIEIVESTDSSNKIPLRSLSSGTYVLKGYFTSYTGGTHSYTFSTGMLVAVLQQSDTSYVQIFYPKSNTIQYLEITDDSVMRQDAKLINMESVANMVTGIDQNSDDSHYPSAKAVHTHIQESMPKNVSELVNDKGYITGYTETDPTVPSWAKSEKKPSYSASEITGIDNYSTQEQAKAYADAKDGAIATAQKAGDDAQSAVDALSNKVGAVPDNKTVVQMISDAQTAATYDDTQVKNDIAENAEAIADLNSNTTAPWKYVYDANGDRLGMERDVASYATTKTILPYKVESTAELADAKNAYNNIDNAVYASMTTGATSQSASLFIDTQIPSDATISSMSIAFKVGTSNISSAVWTTHTYSVKCGNNVLGSGDFALKTTGNITTVTVSNTSLVVSPIIEIELTALTTVAQNVRIYGAQVEVAYTSSKDSVSLLRQNGNAVAEHYHNEYADVDHTHDEYLTEHQDISGKLDKSGGTMTGKLVAQNNADYAVKQVRSVFIIADGESLPTGANGDICLVYTP